MQKNGLQWRLFFHWAIPRQLLLTYRYLIENQLDILVRVVRPTRLGIPTFFPLGTALPFLDETCLDTLLVGVVFLGVVVVVFGGVVDVAGLGLAAAGAFIFSALATAKPASRRP